jgi:putative phosphoesterase
MEDNRKHIGQKRIGLIADTHGLLRASALKALAGVDAIIHAGDIDTPEIISSLKQIAPVFAVRGNMDKPYGPRPLPKYEIVEIDGISIYVCHDLDRLDLDPAAAGFQLVVFGHSHRAEIRYKEGVLYINPGSAGPKRLTLPISVGMLEIKDGAVTPGIIELKE